MNWKDKFPKENIYFETENGILYNGDCIEIMKQFPKESIDLVVTSPPYDDLRSYTNEKEWNFNVFKQVADNLFTVMNNGSVIVWVVGDQTINGDETGNSFRQALYFKEIGFKLYDTMIYEKNGMSNPISKRYHQVFEYMFILSKNKPKTINLIRDRKNLYHGTKVHGTVRTKDGNLSKVKKRPLLPEYGYRTNIWGYSVGLGNSTSDKIAFEHPAIFPEKLARDHIVSWSEKNNIILDPFAGSGTTLKMSEKTNRKWIGIEISEKYCELSKQRILNETMQTKFNF